MRLDKGVDDHAACRTCSAAKQRNHTLARSLVDDVAGGLGSYRAADPEPVCDQHPKLFCVPACPLCQYIRVQRTHHPCVPASASCPGTLSGLLCYLSDCTRHCLCCGLCRSG